MNNLRSHSSRKKLEGLREDLQDQIANGIINHFELKLRQIVFKLREIKNSEDLAEVEKAVSSLAKEVNIKAESWKQNYERGFSKELQSDY